MTQEVAIDYGANLILAERVRQVTCEGFAPDQDDYCAKGVLAEAAAAYLLHAQAQVCGEDPRSAAECFWPWSPDWFKASPDPMRNLVKAGALIAAEIDRLKRRELLNALRPQSAKVEA